MNHKGILSDAELRTLADYNGERARGIMHTAEWDAKMAELQKMYEATMQHTYETAWRA